MDNERLTAIIGIRLYPSMKKLLMEDAKERGQTLTEYILQDKGEHHGKRRGKGTA